MKRTSRATLHTASSDVAGFGRIPLRTSVGALVDQSIGLGLACGFSHVVAAAGLELDDLKKAARRDVTALVVDRALAPARLAAELARRLLAARAGEPEPCCRCFSSCSFEAISCARLQRRRSISRASLIVRALSFEI